VTPPVPKPQPQPQPPPQPLAPKTIAAKTLPGFPPLVQTVAGLDLELAKVDDTRRKPLRESLDTLVASVKAIDTRTVDNTPTAIGPVATQIAGLKDDADRLLGQIGAAAKLPPKVMPVFGDCTLPAEIVVGDTLTLSSLDPPVAPVIPLKLLQDGKEVAAVACGKEGSLTFEIGWEENDVVLPGLPVPVTVTVLLPRRAIVWTKKPPASLVYGTALTAADFAVETLPATGPAPMTNLPADGILAVGSFDLVVTAAAEAGVSREGSDTFRIQITPAPRTVIGAGPPAKPVATGQKMQASWFKAKASTGSAEPQILQPPGGLVTQLTATLDVELGFAPDPNYIDTPTTITVAVQKGAPRLTWPAAPAAVAAGTQLSTVVAGATIEPASLAGAIVYRPTLNTVLAVPPDQLFVNATFPGNADFLPAGPVAMRLKVCENANELSGAVAMEAGNIAANWKLPDPANAWNPANGPHPSTLGDPATMHDQAEAERVKKIKDDYAKRVAVLTKQKEVIDKWNADDGTKAGGMKARARKIMADVKTMTAAEMTAHFDKTIGTGNSKKTEGEQTLWKLENGLQVRLKSDGDAHDPHKKLFCLEARVGIDFSKDQDDIAFKVTLDGQAAPKGPGELGSIPGGASAGSAYIRGAMGATHLKCQPRLPQTITWPLADNAVIKRGAASKAALNATAMTGITYKIQRSGEKKLQEIQGDQIGQPAGNYVLTAYAQLGDKYLEAQESRTITLTN